MKKIYLSAFSAIVLTVFLTIGVFGQTTIALQPFLSGLSSPLFLTNAKDGTNRVFVVEQRGLIRVVEPGSTTPSNFINLASKVSQTGSERGLLGLTFHPEFETNHYFFVNYTRQSDGATVVARYTATNNNTVGDINSERIIITISQDFSNHNGGMVEFGPDGYLYIGMGDGGSGNDPNNRAQNINSLLGKMLRIAPDVSGSMTAPPYTIPPDNPFVGVNGADEIYAYGLRNPFRWSFDRGGTNQLWAGDVGQNAIEEFDIIVNGGNYGWRIFEGNSCTNNDPGLCNPANFIPPIDTYTHAGGKCSITGGYIYRGTQGTFPSGTYTYGDFCSGELFIWDGTQSVRLFATGRSISSFGEDEAGELYLVGLGGTVEKIINTEPLTNNANADFDGDARTDISVYRPSTGVWYAINSSDGSFLIQQFGLDTDVPTPEDFDGDSRTDLGVFRPSEGTWYHFRSSDNTVGITQFGAPGDIPAAGDFDGDTMADIGVFRPSEGVWYILRSSNPQAQITQFGADGDVPVVGDYNGDGRDDIGVFRPSTGVWYRLISGSPDFSVVQFGSDGDIPATGDYDGDGRTDIGVFRPSEGVWYLLNSDDGSATIMQFGLDGDVPTTGDYDGDHREDIGVFRPSEGVWYLTQSNTGGVNIVQFGSDGDQPAPAFDRP
ncbi:MAG: PQQ-dependent sugar dehydrogenase [Pyrinomonadaceae bacterium]